MAGGGKFFISVTPDDIGLNKIITKLNAAGYDTSQAVRRARLQTGTVLLDIINGQFTNAALRNNEAFPPGYLIHLTARLAETPIQSAQISPYSFNVSFNFGDLGTREELSEGYHYGAQLASGGVVTLPYHSAQLKNDIEVRYQFWQALRFHLTYKGRPLDENLWSDTISARLAAWSALGKAPQWLILQYGQEEYEPTNEPYPIVENTREALNLMGKAFLVQHLYDVEVKLMKDTYGQDVNPIPAYDKHGKPSPLNAGFGYYTEAAKEPELLHKQEKLATVYAYYIRDLINAKNNGAVKKAIENLYQLSGVDYTVLLEILRRGGNNG